MINAEVNNISNQVYYHFYLGVYIISNQAYNIIHPAVTYTYKSA